MDRRDFLFTSGALTGSILAGCSKTQIPWIHSDPDLSAQPTTYSLLIDASGSALRKRKAYIESFAKLVNCASHGSRFVVNFITNDPLSDATSPLNEALPSFNAFWDNKPKNDKEAKTARQTLIDKFPSIFHNVPPCNSTPIIDSLKVAERVYQHYPNTRKRLVIYSDMLETRRAFLHRHKQPPPAEKVIAKLKAENALPDICKAEVVIVGANGSIAIENFWKAFFQQLDTKVIEYGAGLIGCP